MTESEWINRLSERVRGVRNEPLIDDDVLSELERALQDCPSSARLWNMRGDLIQGSEGASYSLTDALASYQRAMELEPNDPEAYESLGYYFDAVADRVPDAEPMFRRAIELGGGAASWTGLARVLAELGRKTEALALLAPSSCPCANEPAVCDVFEEIRTGLWDQLNRREDR